MSSIAEIEETLHRIQSHKGVKGVLIVNHDGISIRSTLPAPQTLQYSSLLSTLTQKSRSLIRALDPTDDLTFLRVRSRNYEIMIAPDKEYILIVIQDPNVE